MSRMKSNVVAVGVVVLNETAHLLSVGGWLVHLRADEAALMAILMRAPGRVHSITELAAEAAMPTSSIHRRVRRLMRRLSSTNPLTPALVEAVGPDGYRFTRLM